MDPYSLTKGLRMKMLMIWDSDSLCYKKCKEFLMSCDYSLCDCRVHSPPRLPNSVFPSHIQDVEGQQNVL
ncbi:hypothetical protein IE53DRAFT_145176 [Violaceomyces palustris]|uniref:Uncharacterized protein n=1 Tax=Violaceomyces palustris TaxID=1673888 RepID=A0ACD0P665_9BASI|nr:hypothetical protein IE53DRAFT_145176 [Violaceomyces palustris]